jgi:3-hydroxy acid dehydrogenase / malonic semialdehyde reductase
MQKTVLITGATSGFGMACAQLFAQNGHRIIITGRRANRLQNLATSLQGKYGAEVCCQVFDVQNKEACFNAISNLPANFKTIDILINNAGLALGRDLFNEADLTDWETMIDTNLKGLMYMTKAVLPIMQQQGHGHIINLGSVAGKQVYERGNGYCATKHAVVALSKAMRIDLLPYKIKVTCINPGAADTEFGAVRFKGDKQKADATYQGYLPLVANDVAEVIYYTTTLPAHVCINDLDITCLAQADGNYLYKA